jgi:hypothetical protein
MKNDIHHEIQKNGVTLCREVFPITKYLLKAIPNGGKRNKAEAGKLKAEGVVTGAWDLELCVSYSQRDWRLEIITGLILEVKRPDQRNSKWGGLTPEQVAYGEAMAKQGWNRALCYSAQGIFDVVKKHLERAGVIS